MRNHSLPVALLAALILGIYGCGSSPSAEVSEPADASGGNGSAHNHGGQHADHSGHGESDMEKMSAVLAKLSPEDRASAEQQHFCPVSGEMLGTMGAPIKVDVDGRNVWICCEGCRDSLAENPAEYLAKLHKE